MKVWSMKKSELKTYVKKLLQNKYEYLGKIVDIDVWCSPIYMEYACKVIFISKNHCVYRLDGDISNDGIITVNDVKHLD